MTKAEYKAAITPQFVREFFTGSVVDNSGPRYAITVAGKIVSIGGKIFFGSREQAMKGFYNSFSWRAKRQIWNMCHAGNDGYWWRSPDSPTIWKAFKEALAEQYGFNIIQL